MATLKQYNRVCLKRKTLLTISNVLCILLQSTSPMFKIENNKMLLEFFPYKKYQWVNGCFLVHLQLLISMTRNWEKMPITMRQCCFSVNKQR